MTWLRVLALRFSGMFGKRRRDAQLEEELQSHLEMLVEQNLQRGMPALEARRAAKLSLGGAEQIKEAVRDQRGLPFLESLIADVRFALRMLRKSPGFTTVAVLTLALGIGANTAMFSIAHAVLWRALPYPRPEHLVAASEVPLQSPDTRLGTTYLTFRDWQSRSTAFQNFAAILFDQRIFRGGSEPVRVNGAAVTNDYFDVMGVAPMMGRVISAFDDTAGAAPVVVISYRMWAERLGSDPNVIGRVIPIGRTALFTAIGVMPAGFDDGSTEYWIPLMLVIPSNFATRHVWTFRTVGRLRAGRTAAQAQSELDSILMQIQHDFPEANRGLTVRVEPLQASTSADLRPALLVLLGAVGLVLLIACGNLAALISVRAAGRGRELAIRAALGAGRGRLIAQLLTESALLAFLGGAVGILLAFWATRALALLSKDPRLLHAAINLPVLMFALAATLVTGVLCGIAPAFHGVRETLNSRTGGHRRRARLQQTLVIGEVAMCLVLLVGAGLLFRSLRKILEVDPGFRTDHLVTLRLNLPPTYSSDSQMIQFYRDLPSRLESLPGISAASVVSSLPVAPGEADGDITLEGRPAAPGKNGAASFRRALPNYFEIMGITLLRGRVFDPRDDGENATRVVIINDHMAREFWPNEDPVGKRIKIGPPDSVPWLTIVGVVRDIHNTSLNNPVGYAIYEPLAKGVDTAEDVAVRTTGDPAAEISEVRAELHQLEPALLVDDVATMDARIEDSVSPNKMSLALLELFSGLALLLASIGMYGVIAFSVGQRTQEFGIRMALGAQPGDILRDVFGLGAKMALAGVASGLVASFGLTRLMTSMLFGVSVTDPLTYAAVILILFLVALLACCIPARRASHVDPMVALRHE